jgi:arsenite-transporting ATPase
LEDSDLTRIVMVSGKGGVGKTTVAAATGLAASRRGHRTLILSFDLAHSLSDSFDLRESLFGKDKGETVRVADRLDIQEIDVQEELERDWSEIYRYGASLMTGGGLEGVVAEEMAIMPGLEDVVALIRLNHYLATGEYDLIVLDSPPTAEALRFVSITSSLGWYARKRLSMDRRISGLLRPMGRLSEAMNLNLPDDSYFGALQRLFQKLEGVEEKLRDPRVTTVRLVTNPEKMVVRETQRAFMYFCLYGMTVDAVVVNRILPRSEGYFREWAESQETFTRQIEEYFDPVPVTRLPLLSHEVVGTAHLDEFARLLYGERDAAALFLQAPPYGFIKTTMGDYRLEIPLPFAEKGEIDVSRQREDLVVRIGTFKRNILLPRMIAPLEASNARMEDGKLIIEFTNANP